MTRRLPFVLAASLTAASAVAQSSLSAQQRNHFDGVFSFGTSHRFGRDVLLVGERALVMYGTFTSSYSLQEFEHVGNGWAYRSTLPLGGPRYTMSFGGALALVGNTSAGPNQAGRVGVMRRSASGPWTSTWLDAPAPGTPADAFGISTSIHGSTVVISNSEHTHNFASEGALYLFEDDGANLVLRQTIYGGSAGAHLGTTVELDGSDMIASLGVGSFGLRSFRESGGAWAVLQDTIPVPALPSAQVEMHQGLAVVRTSTATLLSLANSGNGWFAEGTVTSAGQLYINDFDVYDGVIAAGVPDDPTLAAGAGAVRVYARNDGWQLQQIVTASDGAIDDYLGYGCVLDGAQLLAGAPNHDHWGSDNGGVYGFELTHAPAQVYCVPELTSSGCVARMSFQGTPSMSSATPFLVAASHVEPNRAGSLAYGTNGRIFQPYPGGVRCIAPPRRMTARQFSGSTGAACTGALTFDFNAFAQSGVDPLLAVGVTVDAQWIFRDPTGPSALASSAAIEFTLLP